MGFLPEACISLNVRASNAVGNLFGEGFRTGHYLVACVRVGV